MQQVHCQIGLISVIPVSSCDCADSVRSVYIIGLVNIIIFKGYTGVLIACMGAYGLVMSLVHSQTTIELKAHGVCS